MINNRIAASELSSKISYLTSQAETSANKSEEYANLGGIGPEDGHHNQYDVLIEECKKSIRILAQQIKDAKFLKGHAHEWDENDYCIYCGADGRA